MSPEKKVQFRQMSFISCEVSEAVGNEIIYDIRLLLRYYIYTLEIQSSENVNELSFSFVLLTSLLI